MEKNYFFEAIIFFYLLKTKAIKNFEKKYFSEPTIINIFDYVKDFVTEYNTTPTADQIIEIIKLNGKDDLIPAENVHALWDRSKDLNNYDNEWLENAAEYFGQYRSFYTSLENTIAYVQSWPKTMNYSDIAPYITKARDIFNKNAGFTIQHTTGHDLFDFDTHQINPEATHTTGFNFLDLCLNGGFAEKCLYVFMGGPKSGKSMWLCSMAANAVREGFNSVYVTLELYHQKVAQRIGANLFNIPIETYGAAMADPVYFNKAVQAFNNSQIKPAGKLIIMEFPTSSLTAAQLESELLKKQEELRTIYGPDFKIDNVFIDYLNIMRDQRGSIAGDTYNKIKNICEDVRAVMQRQSWSGISVTQTNRGGIDAEDSKTTDVAESAGLLATVDGLMGIIRNVAMRTHNVYYLKALAMRDSKYMGTKKRYNFNPTTLRITEDPTENILQEDEMVPMEYRSIEMQALESYKKKINNQKQNTTVPENTTFNLQTTEKQLSTKPLFGTAEELFNI